MNIPSSILSEEARYTLLALATLFAFTIGFYAIGLACHSVSANPIFAPKTWKLVTYWIFYVVFVSLYEYITLLGQFNSSFAIGRWILKPMIMPVILAGYVITTTEKIDIVVVLAFLFGGLGDYALLYPSSNVLSFICGLGAFLIGHLCYVVALRRRMVISHPVSRFWTVEPIVFCFFAAALLNSVLLPNVKSGPILGQRIAIVFYSLVICSMHVSAVWLTQCIKLGNPRAVFWTRVGLAGSILFMISDTTLSITMFVRGFPYQHEVIMSTYIFGQTLLALCLAFVPRAKKNEK